MRSYPALKGRAKVRPPLRGESIELASITFEAKLAHPKGSPFLPFVNSANPVDLIPFATFPQSNYYQPYVYPPNGERS